MRGDDGRPESQLHDPDGHSRTATGRVRRRAPTALPFGAAPPPPPAGSGWDQSYRHRHRDGGGRWWSLFGGLVLLGLGLWFFADKTLGIDMPDLRWSQLWPLILIVVGVLVLLGALRRERH